MSSSPQKYFTFRYGKQPWKTLYTLYTLVTVPFIKLPFFVFRAALFKLPLFTRLNPRPASWSFLRTVYIDIYKQFVTFLGQTGIPGHIPPDLASKDVKQRFGIGFDWVEPIPEEQGVLLGDVLEAARVNGVGVEKRWGYWYGKPKKGGKVFYFLHGGGFILGSAHPTDPLTSQTTKHLLTHCPSSTLFAIEYRLSTAGPYPQTNAFPAALIDALSGYYHLVHTCGIDPQDIILSGSSAGGSLAVGMVIYILKYGLGGLLPLPRALWLESPAVDWGNSHLTPGGSMMSFQTSDTIETFIQPNTDYCIRAVLGNLPLSSIETNPYISPASKGLGDGLYKNFPDVALTYGGSEMLRDIVWTLRDRLREGGCNVMDIQQPDCSHVFSTLMFHQEDIQEAFGKVGEWYRGL